MEQGADLETRDAEGDTPLLIAVQRGNHRLARHLINHGADVNTRNTAGQTVLQIANNLGLGDIAQLLVRNGAQTLSEE